MVPPNHPILIGFSIIFTIHFGVPLFNGNIRIYIDFISISHGLTGGEITSNWNQLRIRPEEGLMWKAGGYLDGFWAGSGG